MVDRTIARPPSVLLTHELYWMVQHECRLNNSGMKYRSSAPVVRMYTSENAGLVERLSNRDLVVRAAPVSACLAIPKYRRMKNSVERQQGEQGNVARQRPQLRWETAQRVIAWSVWTGSRCEKEVLLPASGLALRLLHRKIVPVYHSCPSMACTAALMALQNSTHSTMCAGVYPPAAPK